MESVGYFQGVRTARTARGTRGAGNSRTARGTGRARASGGAYRVLSCIHSSGKMGYEIARAARDMGADVTLISGPVQLNVPHGVRVVQIVSAQDMFEAVQQEYADCDIIIKAAAVGDYRAQKNRRKQNKKTGRISGNHLCEKPGHSGMAG